MDEPFTGLDPVNVALLKAAFLEMRDRGQDPRSSAPTRWTWSRSCATRSRSSTGAGWSPRADAARSSDRPASGWSGWRRPATRTFPGSPASPGVAVVRPGRDYTRARGRARTPTRRRSSRRPSRAASGSPASRSPTPRSSRSSWSWWARDPTQDERTLAARPGDPGSLTDVGDRSATSSSSPAASSWSGHGPARSCSRPSSWPSPASRWRWPRSGSAGSRARLADEDRRRRSSAELASLRPGRAALGAVLNATASDGRRPSPSRPCRRCDGRRRPSSGATSPRRLAIARGTGRRPRLHDRHEGPATQRTPELLCARRVRALGRIDRLDRLGVAAARPGRALRRPPA